MYFIKLHICINFYIKFQVSSIILSRFRQGVILPTPSPKQTPKKPTLIRVNSLNFFHASPWFLHSPPQMLHHNNSSYHPDSKIFPLPPRHLHFLLSTNFSTEQLQGCRTSSNLLKFEISPQISSNLLNKCRFSRKPPQTSSNPKKISFWQSHC